MEGIRKQKQERKRVVNSVAIYAKDTPRLVWIIATAARIQLTSDFKINK